jgi:hypothetical protein
MEAWGSLSYSQESVTGLEATWIQSTFSHPIYLRCIWALTMSASSKRCLFFTSFASFFFISCSGHVDLESSNYINCLNDFAEIIWAVKQLLPIHQGRGQQTPLWNFPGLTAQWSDWCFNYSNNWENVGYEDSTSAPKTRLQYLHITLTTVATVRTGKNTE